MIETLEQLGHTYVIDDGVYFDVSTFPRYAEFAGLDLDELATSGRVEHVEDKRHPADFALWKLTAPGVVRQQEWDSPWGRGFPGWHIECSAMATKYLGDRFDIHTGGVDHVRVHHTNEVAQSECALGVHPWVGTWVHTEFLDLGGAKISKSKGDVLLVDTLEERGIDPLAFRYFTLQAHYRQQQAFTFEAVQAAGVALRRLVGHAVAARDAGGEVADPARGRRLPPPLLVGAGRRPQHAPGPRRACPTRPRTTTLSAGRALGGAVRRRSRPGLRPGRRRGADGGRDRHRTRASTGWWPSARRPAPAQRLRHRRPRPRRARRRGHRDRRHPHRPHLAPRCPARARERHAERLEPSEGQLRRRLGRRVQPSACRGARGRCTGRPG